MKEQVYFFMVNTAQDCKKWVEVLRKSKNTIEEMERTKFNTLKRNIDPLVFAWRFKDLDVKEKAKKDLDRYISTINLQKDSVPDIIETLVKAVDFLEFTLDALQSQRPFYPELYELYMQAYHQDLTDWISNFWNEKTAEFGGPEILGFVDILMRQESSIIAGGMSDPRYKESYNEIIGAFSVRYLIVIN